MGQIAGAFADTFNRPQFTNEVISITPAETAFLTMAGGARGGSAVFAKDFSWSTVDNEAAAIPAILEGGDPTYNERTRTEIFNTLQIFQEGIEETYTALAVALQQGPFASTRVWAVSDPVGQGGSQDWQLQINLKLEAIAKNMNLAFLTGTYSRPADNVTARTTAGMLGVVTTNVEAEGTVGPTDCDFDFTGGAQEDLWTSTAHGLEVGDEVQFVAGVGSAAPTEYTKDTSYWVVAVPLVTTFQLSASKGGAVLAGTADATVDWEIVKHNALTKTGIDNLMRTMAINGARRGTLTAFCGPYNRQQFSSVYGYAPESRTEGGVAIERVLTDFGTLDVVYDRQLPEDTILIAEMADVEIKFLEIPGKGHMFIEPVAATGASVRSQFYGEAGLKYGWEGNHAQITGLTTVP